MFGAEFVPFCKLGFVLEVDVFDLGFLFVAGFDAVFPDDFDAVVSGWVVAGGDDDCAVEPVVFDCELDGGCGCHACEVDVAACSG